MVGSTAMCGRYHCRPGHRDRLASWDALVGGEPPRCAGGHRPLPSWHRKIKTLLPAQQAAIMAVTPPAPASPWRQRLAPKETSRHAHSANHVDHLAGFPHGLCWSCWCLPCRTRQDLHWSASHWARRARASTASRSSGSGWCAWRQRPDRVAGMAPDEVNRCPYPGASGRTVVRKGPP